MNISGASFTVTSEDIKSIITDFLEVPNLIIDKIEVDKHIYISGSYKKFIKLNFDIAVSIVNIRKQEVLLTIEKVHIGKLSVFKWIRNLVLSKLTKILKEYGLTSDKGIIKLSISSILKKLPVKLDFKLHAVELYKNKVYIEVEKISLNLKGQPILEKIAEPVPQEENMKSAVVIIEDQYTEFREEINSKLPEKFKGLMPYMMLLPDILALFMRLFKDKRVPLKVKLICGSIIAYFALPIDIVPDFLPILGKVDDVAIAFYALDKMLCELPEEIIKDNWAGNEDIILMIRKGINLIYKTIGTSNLVKGYSWIASKFRKKNKAQIEIEVKETVKNAEEVLCD
ncbi:YkvA family protein [Clostridium thermarum]|uniref:YkvA family protein n=1 Tax=Clostridium thermarum TaxID=1716543 RepID=UPI0013D8D36B|nr:YkvA family protein [Clostridium thermarum]